MNGRRGTEKTSQEETDSADSDADDSLLEADSIAASAAREAAETKAGESAPPDPDATGISSGRPLATSTEPAVGSLVSGRYRLEKVLGEGGMGKVFLAVDELYAGSEFRDRKAQVALKFLSRNFASNSKSRIALQRETRKSQQLSHPNVVRVLHFDQHDGNPYMIMEYMEGQPLDDLLRTRASNGEPLRAVTDMIGGMALGLDYIHGQGLVHSDFKPNNVLVGTDGSAKILDLGIARANVEEADGEESTLFDTGSLGALTPAYASCEMFEGLDPDPRDDIYAFACVIYELLAGRHPFDRVAANKARADAMEPGRLEHLNRAQWQALKQGLAFERKDRTASAAALVEGLRGEKKRRKQLLTGLIAFAAVAVVAAILLAVEAIGPEDPDQVFMNQLAALSARAGELTGEDSARIERWLEQGSAYLDIAAELFEQGDMLSAHQLLLQGADNAQRAFTSVLELTSAEEARRGMLAMVELYAGWAEAKLDEGDPTGALWAACAGLGVHPTHEILLDLSDAARSELPASANTDCGHIRTQLP